MFELEWHCWTGLRFRYLFVDRLAAAEWVEANRHYIKKHSLQPGGING